MAQNSLIQKALQFAGEKIASPEAIIYSCAKLALMNDGALEACLSPEELAELKQVRKYFESTKFDMTLIRSGIPVIKTTLLEHLDASSAKEYTSFKDAIAKEQDALSLVKKAIEVSVVDFINIFAQGKSMTDVFDFLDKLKEKPATDGEYDFTLKSMEAAPAKGEEAKPAPNSGSTPEPAPASAPTPATTLEKPSRTKPGIEKPSRQAAPTEEPSEEDKEIYNLISSDNITTMHSGFLLLQAKLLEEIKGQDQAILKFCRGYFEGEVIYRQTKEHERPKNFFFLFGPPGVGKTMLSKRIAKYMGVRAEIFNMSEADPNHIRGFISAHPDGIVVLDEIEKASPSVMMLLLQVLGSGQLAGADCTKTTIIFTSNVGKELYDDPSTNVNNIPEKVIIDAIANAKKMVMGTEVNVFPPEIVSRLATGNVISFNHIAPIYLREMADARFEHLTQAMSEKYSWHITYPSTLSTMFFFVRGVDLDARVVSGQADKFLLHEVYEISNLMNAGTISEDSTRINFTVSLDGATEQIQKLFHNPAKTRVLFFSDKKHMEQLNYDKDKYEILWTDNVTEALDILNQDIDAVFVDVLCNPTADNTSILSVNDYKTAGVELFYRLADKILDVNIYVLDRDNQIPKMDRETFISDGAARILPFDTTSPDDFLVTLNAIMDAEYMETQAREFSGCGMVLDYKSRQVVEDDKTLRVEFYDLKSKLGIDPASRGIMLADGDVPDVTFDDVVGAKAAKKALSHYISYLQNPTAYLLNHPAPAKGILMFGPAGTGKTMLAKAMANEARVRFFATNAAGFKSKWVGESEENVRKLFAQARKVAPSIIFIDEIDALGGKRGTEDSDRHDASLLTELLHQMDGFSLNPKKPVFVIAATNVPVKGENSQIDPALLSRFSQQIEVKLPEKEERLEFIRRALAKRKITSITEEEMESFATRTVNFGLRVLQNVIDTAVTMAEEENRDLTIGDLMEARERAKFGEKSEQKYSFEYYDRVAHHEAGHAIANYRSGITPSFICIASRANFGGYAEHITEGMDPSMNREDCLNRIVTCLAGRAAEEVFYGKKVAVNTGASSDLEQATDMVIDMLCALGMEDGNLFVMSRKEMMGSPMASDIIAKANKILAEQYTAAIQLIEENKDVVERIAQYLLDKNEISSTEFLAIVNEGK